MEVYYLVKSDNFVHSKFEVDDRSAHYVSGKCFNCISWENDGCPYEYEFLAYVTCKWDSCTHWRFLGEEFNPEIKTTNTDGVDAYYHLCGSYCFLSHIRAMCFVWKLVEQLMTKSGQKLATKEYYDNAEIKALIDMMLTGYNIVKGEE